MPIAAITIKPANISGTLNCEADCIIRYPIPSLDAIVSEITAPTKASVTETFNEAKEERHRPRQSHFAQDVERGSAERSQHVLKLRLDRCKAGRNVHRNREKRQQERGRDRRRLPDSHPKNEDWHNRPPSAPS